MIISVAVQLVGAGLGKDLDAAVAELVILRGERILVDADFADRRLGRKLPAGESIDEDLRAVRPGGRSGKRGQFALQARQDRRREHRGPCP